VSFNHRVCHRPTVPGGGYSIHEVYYDDDGDVTMYTENPIAAYGDLPDELEWELQRHIDAFNKPILNLNHIDHLIKIKQQVRKENDGML